MVHLAFPQVKQLFSLYRRRHLFGVNLMSPGLRGLRGERGQMVSTPMNSLGSPKLSKPESPHSWDLTRESGIWEAERQDVPSTRQTCFQQAVTESSIPHVSMSHTPWKWSLETYSELSTGPGRGAASGYRPQVLDSSDALKMSK